MDLLFFILFFGMPLMIWIFAFGRFHPSLITIAVVVTFSFVLAMVSGIEPFATILGPLFPYLTNYTPDNQTEIAEENIIFPPTNRTQEVIVEKKVTEEDTFDIGELLKEDLT